MIGNLKSIYMSAIKEGYGIIEAKKDDITNLVFACDEFGDTFLHFALYDENIEAIKYLMESGSYPLAYNSESVHPLAIASKCGNIEILKYLIAKSKCCITEYVEAELFATAAVSGLFDNVKCLLNNNLNCKIPFRNESIVSWALQSENLDIVKLLCEYGAPINDSNEDGITPLYSASAEGLLEITEFLLSRGAEVNKSSNIGCTPLIIASCFGHVEIVKLLLKNGADVDFEDNDKETALSYAIKYGHEKVVNELLTIVN